MEWMSLVFAKDWPEANIKKGDPTGSYISKNQEYIIEPYNAEKFLLRGRTEKALKESNYKTIIGFLDELKSYDLKLLTKK